MAAAIAALASIPAHASSQTLFPWYNRRIEPGQVYASAFATGRVQGAATGTDTQNPVQANGSAGVSLQMHRLTVAGFVNVVTSVDSVSGDFGPALLTPAVGGGFRAGAVELRFTDVVRSYGVRGYGSISNSIWHLPLDSLKPDTFTTRGYSASIVGAGVTVFRQWQAFADSGSTPEPNRVAFALEGGMTWRRLSGDIANQDDFRMHLLGTEARSYIGVEAGMTLTINNIAAGIQMYRMWSLKGSTLRGLTGTQVSTGLSLEGNLFSFLTRLR
jgi:hypothetical protein